jgi:hypothetical protein
MRRKVLVGVAVLLLAVSTATGEGLNAAIQFTAIDFACAGGNIVVSTEPLVNGTSLTTATFIDEKKFLVNATFFPTAFPGSTWVLPGQGRLLPHGFVVHHLGIGTGDLAGGMIKLKVQPVDAAPPPGCTLVGPVVELDGVIIFPPGQTQ